MPLSQNQTKAFNQLLPSATIALDPSTKNLPIKPRTHTLMCAPSGSGKSHLMLELGKLAEIPVLLLNVSTWQPMGSRGDNYTWDTIVDFLKKNPRGIIVLDEIDKIDSPSDWQGYLRLEMHDLLDGKIPVSVKIQKDEPSFSFSLDDDDDSKEDKEDSFTREELEEILKHSYYIVAAGAWQHLWEKEDASPVGFHTETKRQALIPSQQSLRDSIKPELLKRFRSEIIVMQPMTRCDYEMEAKSLSQQLPEHCRDLFFNLAHKRIDQAVKEKIGMRYFEEVLSETLSHRLLQEPDSEKRFSA